MKKTSNSVSIFFSRTSAAVLLMAVICLASCTKDPEPTPVPIPPPTPVVTPPSGTIESFVVTDSLVPFFTAGPVLKWLVTGTNTQTVITINGVKVLEYGFLATGPLKQTTKFVLAVNNGKRDSVTVKVADSITTLLWNKGRRLKLIKREKYTLPPNSTLKDWVLDTPINAAVADERYYFYYTNTSDIYQLTAKKYVSLADGGKFTVSRTPNPTYYSFSWRGNIYFITRLDENLLHVEFDETQTNGTIIPVRHQYMYEPG